MVYDIDSPTAPRFVEYVNNRNFQGDAEAGTAGYLGPEGITFIPAADSPVRDRCWPWPTKSAAPRRSSG